MAGKASIASGDDSVNVNAGGDVAIGVSASEVRAIALDVFKANILELRGVAEDVAASRAERVTDRFIEGLQARNPQLFERFNEPGVQRALFEVQKEAACADDEVLEEQLAGLLVERLVEQQRTTRALALDGALTVLPKLTREQARLVCATFMARYTRLGSLVEWPLYLQRLDDIWSLLGKVKMRAIDEQHLLWAGACTRDSFPVDFVKAVMSGYEGFWSKGFSIDAAPPLNPQYIKAPIFVPSVHNSDGQHGLQYVFRDEEDMRSSLGAMGFPSPDIDAQVAHMQATTMTEEEVAARITGDFPDFERLADAWKDGFGRLLLTTPGLAIGYTVYKDFKQVDSSVVDIGIWLD